MNMPENLYEKIIRCTRCGNCLAFCPVFKETKKESESARGKLFLILSYLSEKEIFTASHLEDKIYKCLSCFSCSFNCPAGIDVFEIIEEMRREFVNKKGMSFNKRIIFKIFQKNFIFLNSLKILNISKKIIPEILKNRFRIFFLPDFHFKRYPEFIKSENPKIRVGIFLGCSFKFAYPEVVENMIKILQRNSIEIVIPPEQNCCGMPFKKIGAYEIASSMIKRNSEIFKRYLLDFIVTACASCGLMLKKEMKDFSVFDISEFIVKKNLKYVPTVKNLRVTFHDPCHLVRGQKIYDEPRKIIKNIGLDLKEHSNSDTCCGCAGTFTIYYPELSLDILKNKIDNLLKSEPSLVVTHCPACMFQLQYGLKEKKIKVVHTLQLIN